MKPACAPSPDISDAPPLHDDQFVRGSFHTLRESIRGLWYLSAGHIIYNAPRHRFAHITFCSGLLLHLRAGALSAFLGRDPKPIAKLCTHSRHIRGSLEPSTGIPVAAARTLPLIIYHHGRLQTFAVANGCRTFPSRQSASATQYQHVVQQFKPQRLELLVWKLQPITTKFLLCTMQAKLRRV